MRARTVLLIAAGLSFLCGCGIPPPRSFALPVIRSDEAAVLDDGCAPHDPRIPVLLARLHALSGREGYYARRELAAGAKDRDELVLRVLRREEVAQRCLRDNPWKSERRRTTSVLVRALLSGKDPADWQSYIVVHDVRLKPRTMPFARRLCTDARGEAAGLACIAFGPPAAFADIVTFPLGTWIWAAKDVSEAVPLSSIAPSPEASAALTAFEAKGPL